VWGKRGSVVSSLPVQIQTRDTENAEHFQNVVECKLPFDVVERVFKMIQVKVIIICK
jgi:hypothetical protein